MSRDDAPAPLHHFGATPPPRHHGAAAKPMRPPLLVLSGLASAWSQAAEILRNGDGYCTFANCDLQRPTTISWGHGRGMLIRNCPGGGVNQSAPSLPPDRPALRPSAPPPPPPASRAPGLRHAAPRERARSSHAWRCARSRAQLFCGYAPRSRRPPTTPRTYILGSKTPWGASPARTAWPRHHRCSGARGASSARRVASSPRARDRPPHAAGG